VASIFDKIKGHIDRGVDRAGMFFNDPDVIRAMSVEQIEPDAPVGDAFKRYGAATLGGPGDIYSLIWKDLIGAESDLPGFRSLPTSETLQKRFGAPQGPEYMAVDFLASDPFSMLGKTIKGARQIRKKIGSSPLDDKKLSGLSKKEKIAKLRAEANAQRFAEKIDTSYRGQHQPKGYDDFSIRLDNLTKSITGEQAGYPDDFYTSQGRRIYAPPARFFDDEYGIANTQSYNAILKAKGNPEAEVTIYRAVPNERNITKINEGDFVTLSPKYAELHGASGYGSGGQDAGKILSQKVKVKDLLWDGNDVNEFGYFPHDSRP